MKPLAHEAIQELLGAYALHAVDADEAEVVDRHLEGCPRCRAEVEGHREVATLLANSGGAAPEGLWDRIASQLEEAPPPMRLEVSDRPGAAAVIPLAPRRRPPASRWVAAVVGAAAVFAIAVLGSQVVRQQDRLDAMRADLELTTLQAAANQAFDDPGAVKVQLRSSDGAVTARAVVLPDGTGFLMAHELPGLEPDRTYQLWGQTGSSLVSLGVLGEDPTTVAFQADGDLAALAITAEEAGGVPTSRNPALLTGTFD